VDTEEHEIETNIEDPLPEGIEQETPEVAGEDNAAATQDDAPDPEEDGNEVVVSIGEPDPQAEEERKAPQWVRDLRKADREKTRRIKELEAKLNTQPTEIKPVVVGKKPTIEDFDYDAEKFESALTDWFEKKRRADEEEQRRRDAAKAESEAWQGKLNNYQKLKADIKVKDFQEAELETQNTLSVVQQGIVVQGADNPALVVYAIGKNPAKAKELAAITDPVKFTFAVAKLEAQLKVTPKKSVPEPERAISGTGRTSGSVDSTLERLREEAARTGDSSKVVAYKRQKQNAKP
jgi:hypothetical protein